MAKAGGALCKECPFSRNGAPHNFVPAAVPRQPYGVVIAESPGREEAERGEPLMGHTGKQFNQELLDAGLVRERLVLIYAIACQPPFAHTEADMRAAVRACNALFWHQLSGVAPQTPSLICGKWAALAAHGEEKSLMAHRGFVDEAWLLKKRELK